MTFGLKFALGEAATGLLCSQTPHTLLRHRRALPPIANYQVANCLILYIHHRCYPKWFSLEQSRVIRTFHFHTGLHRRIHPRFEVA
jgi:hypothetical protein